MNSENLVEKNTNTTKPKPSDVKRPQCTICSKSISDRRNLVRHLRKIHGVEPLVRKPQLKCSFNNDCTFLCATSEILREHLKNFHNIKIVKKVFHFNRRSEFEKWKQEEELHTNARYVSYTGTKCRGSNKVYYLKCHRSGMIRTNQNSERKRSKPFKGYTQCGTTCPSSIRVAETSNGSIQVMYYPVHVGHTLDEESIQYMKLSSKEREEIVGKLALGEPVGKIVLDARKKRGSKLSRINLLQRRDVYNIKKKVNYLEKDEYHDGEMIDVWVKNLKVNESNNPIMLYCPVNETKDYILVLIHKIQKEMHSIAFDGSTVYVKIKKGKQNVDFTLIAICIICENGDSYPVAFCISHKIEYITIYTFFKIVYQNFGLIKTQIFVSDNISQFYLAWKNVFGECDSKLMCTFDLESLWEQKLSLLKCPLSKQKAVCAQFKTLLNQPDKSIFEEDLLEILISWQNDQDMMSFNNFFQKFYLEKRFEWATCYRLHSKTQKSINLYLEPVNKMLDSIYVESYCDLQNSLNSLFGFVRDVCLLKLLKCNEKIKLSKLQETEKNHIESLKIKQVLYSGSNWIVTDCNLDYVIRKNDCECDKKCEVFCEACNICIHNYTCVCSDYVIGFDICRHIHAVATLTGETNTRDLKDLSTASSRRSAVALTKTLATEILNSNLGEKEYNKIVEKISLISEEIKRTKKQS